MPCICKNTNTPSTGGRDLTDRRDIAEAINTGLINRIEHMVASTDNETSSPTTKHSPLCTEVPEFAFTPIDESTVIDLLKKVDVCKAMGCDNIQARALKLTAGTIAGPLCNLFNLVLKLLRSHWNGKVQTSLQP